MRMSSKPLLTMILVAYKQENFIGAAIEAAFNQTYENLEIIISDDCSNDATFQIIEQKVSLYNGSHRIRINRNEKNLGIVGHINKLIHMAEGEFIIVAAGDDVSREDRAAVLSDSWVNGMGKINSIFSNLQKIDENGKNLGSMFASEPRFAKNIHEYKLGAPCWVLGASFSFEKSIYLKYGDVPPFALQEDGCIAFRCLLDGNIQYLDEELVSYRHHDKNISQGDDPRKRIILQKKQYVMISSWLSDALISRPEDSHLINHLKMKFAIAKIKAMFFSVFFLGYMYNFCRIKLKLILR